MSDWKKAFRSFYYETAEDPDDIALGRDSTAVLVIDIQNTYLEPKDTPEENERWQPFFDRMNNIVIPNSAKLFAWRLKRTPRPSPKKRFWNTAIRPFQPSWCQHSFA